MITARKSAWFARLFALYNRNLLTRRFEGLRVRGLDHLRDGDDGWPLVLYCNHSSWWDGLVAFHLSQICQLDSYAMMEEKQLREYPFHRKLGAFSVVREDPRRAFESINYAADLLRDRKRTLWIFPQGRTQPNDLRPLALYGGAARIVERVRRTRAAPIAMRYEFLNDFRPEMLVRVGAPEKIEANPEARLRPKALTTLFAKRLTDELDALRADIVNEDLGEYREVLAPRRRRNETRGDD